MNRDPPGDAGGAGEDGADDALAEAAHADAAAILTPVAAAAAVGGVSLSVS